MSNKSQVEELPSETANPVNNNASAVRTEESSSVQTEPPTLKSPVEDKKSLRLPLEKATGPRTLTGKRWSSRNSIKHGIFSSPLLLGEKNAKLYRYLLKSLDESLDPQCMLESLLVEKLATIVWRYRRLLHAESDEIYKNVDLVMLEKCRREDAAMDARVAMEDHLAKIDKVGLIPRIGDPSHFERCLDLLSGVRMEVSKFGFDFANESLTLARVYGARYEGRPGKDLFDVYLDCENASRASETERQKRGFESAADCVEKFLDELEKEIQRLEGLRKIPEANKASSRNPKPPDLELLACKVPDSPELDRLLRYEASLERSFDRTLSQLERLQRMRLGQPVPPPINLNVSSS